MVIPFVDTEEKVNLFCELMRIPNVFHVKVICKNKKNNVIIINKLICINKSRLGL